MKNFNLQPTSMAMIKWPWFVLAIVIVLLDQISKYWAASTLVPYQPDAILPMFNLTLAFNTGSAFNFLDTGAAWHRWFFSLFSIVMSVALIIWILRLSANACLQLLAFSLILGGALGNLVDRAFFGYVVDFLDVYYKTHHWPVFNLADSAICVGAFLLIIDLGRSKRT